MENSYSHLKHCNFIPFVFYKYLFPTKGCYIAVFYSSGISNLLFANDDLNHQDLQNYYFFNYLFIISIHSFFLVNALYALIDVDICHFHHCDSRFYVSRDGLVQTAMKLSDFLKYEFITVLVSISALFIIFLLIIVEI